MIPILAIVALAAAQESPTELTVVPFAPHDDPVVALHTDSKGKRLFSMTEKGAVAEWSEKKEAFLWQSEPDKLANQDPSAGALRLSVGAKACTRSSFGPVMAYDRVDLEEGAVTTGGGAPMSAATMNNQVFTGAIATDPKDKWVWLGGSDGSLVRLMLADPLKGWSTRKVDNDGVTDFAIGPKGKEIAIGGADGTIRFVGNSSCDVDEDEVFSGHKSPISSVVWDPAGKTVLSADRQGQVIIHNRRNGKVVRMLAAPGRELRCLAIHPKGKWLAAGATDGTIHVWKTKDGALLATATIDDTSSGVTAMCFLKGGKTLYVSAGRLLHRIDVEDVGK